MLKVLSSPDVVDVASISAMLGEGSSEDVVQQLLALRAQGDGSDFAAGSSAPDFQSLPDNSVAATMNFLGDALNQKGARAQEDLKKISGDMKKNFQKLGFPSSLGATFGNLGKKSSSSGQ